MQQLKRENVSLLFLYYQRHSRCDKSDDKIRITTYSG
ncbi:hypothetical protein FLACOL7796_04644 [Flavobacterium collinsii]|uniref:Uncharacterized protein n=1 Tax=Flavobacterium collinsii TaxID=1114861 RepID=A0ABN7ERV6_9FLAO|nr:hypothetical protein FLACOL7796_04644 [Flavobacterium collinsii]